jgi:CheY-like chemotaxis protein
MIPPVLLSHVAGLISIQDNVINQKVLATYLRKLGYSYSICSNGREAVDRFAEGGIDAVFMDIEMPVRASSFSLCPDSGFLIRLF